MTLEIGSAIAFAALLLAAVQTLMGYRRQKSEMTFRLIESFNDSTSRLQRFRFGDHLRKAKEFDNDFGKLGDDELSDISAVAAAFGYAGLLAKKRKIELNVFLELWGSASITTWNRLQPYKQYWIAKYKQPVGHWRYFEWLAEKAVAKGYEHKL